MGCGSSKGGQSGAKNDNPPIEEIDVPDTDPRYPAPTPPKTNKDDFYKPSDYDSIDSKIKQQLTRINASSYESLAAALSATHNTDLQKLRAIFVWLYLQDIHGGFYSGVTDPYTPRGYMKLIKTKGGSYASFFAQLCRAAGIPCNVIRGVGRGDNYEVGQTDMAQLGTAWCAVHVDGNWRLIHPLWAFFQEKQTYVDGKRPPAGTKRPSINEFFYLIDPNKMICFCLPQSDAWQLLKKRWDAKKFNKSPQFTENYFSSGLMLPRKYNAIVPDDNGVCVIDFDHHAHDEPSVEPKVEFTGNQDGEKGQGLPSDVRMSEYVVTSSSSTRKTVVVKFPAPGRYTADVYGGKDASRPKIVEFRLDCEDTVRAPQPFPLRPQGGFGLLPGPASTLGVSDIIPDSGIVEVRATQEKLFSFTTSQELELEAKLVHSTAAPAALADFVSCQASQHQGQVKVVIPEEATLEFGLEIRARPAKSSRQFTAVANYLLVDENWRRKTAVVSPTRNTGQDAVRRALVAATQRSDIARLEKAVADFQRQGLPDNGDLTKARRRLIELHLNNLQARTVQRKLEPLDDAIEAAKRSQVAADLIDTKEMREAEAARKQLRRLKLYMHKVLALNKATISEIHHYNRPRPLVHNVMKATFRILGEPQSKIQNWTYIQSCMRQLGRNSMMSRVRQFDPISLKQGQVRDAETHLSETNKYLVRMCSAGAGTFYVWSNNMISEYQGKGKVDLLDIWQGDNKWTKTGNLAQSQQQTGGGVRSPGRTWKRAIQPKHDEARDVYGQDTERNNELTGRAKGPNSTTRDVGRGDDLSLDSWDPNAPFTGRSNERHG